jgi:hypothetical protein
MIWSQIGELTVPVKVLFDGKPQSRDGKPQFREEPLFREYGKFFVPAYNEMVKDSETAKVFYRALGRIFAYCILHNEAIANHVMPSIYKNYLLRGVSPKDPKYKLIDLVSHIFEILPNIKMEPSAGHHDIITNFLIAYGDHTSDVNEDPVAIEQDYNLPDDFPGASSIEAKFRKCVYEEYISNRNVALESILEGLQLNGMFVL